MLHAILVALKLLGIFPDQPILSSDSKYLELRTRYWRGVYMAAVENYSLSLSIPSIVSEICLQEMKNKECIGELLNQ